MVVANNVSDITPPAVKVDPDAGSPVRRIKSTELVTLGQNLNVLFGQYISDRRIAELRWLRNLRQYLGIYDPEIENELAKNRSKAYPRITRVKVISTLSRIMNLMFPGNERNWTLKASPSPDMSPQDVSEAIQKAKQKDSQAGVQPELTLQYVMAAVQTLADERAAQLAIVLDDQLQELGGDQTLDYVALNRKVAQSGILYGIGVLRGPYARSVESTTWALDPQSQQPMPVTKTAYKPMFEFLPIWDFYPDMSAKTLTTMDGYFTRVVMSRAQVRKLADREDFFSDNVRTYLSTTPKGNYKAQPFETELRTLGVKINVNEQKAETSKFEVIVWNGPVSGHVLEAAGVDIAEDKRGDDIDAEIWLLDQHVIKADINPWRKLGVDVRTIHTFLFDEDDTSPVGSGLPNVMRDSQLAVSAATRMLLDNASVVCGPNLEVNTAIMRPDQDLNGVSAYKIWYRDDDGQTMQFPAVRNVEIQSHMDELLKTIDLFMKFADAETFVGPATGGDMAQAPSEPMRTAAGASMLRGDAALPFKDIVRNFDMFTQSLIDAMVQFNRKFNPDLAPEGDYNVIARGATSLIAKEVRGMQLDQLAATLTPAEAKHVDERKLVEQRFAVRDLGDLLVSKAEADRRQAVEAQTQQEQLDQQREMMKAQIRKTLADAFKGISQGQKNTAAADAATVQAALGVLEQGLNDATDTAQGEAKPANGNSDAGGQRGAAGSSGAGGLAA